MKLIVIIALIVLIFKWNKLGFFWKLITIMLCVSLFKGNYDDVEELNFFFEEPAQCWEETLPLGNGRLGIMPDGEIEKENIII